MTAAPFVFRPLLDVTLMHQWLQRPHVAEWWEPTTLEELAADYLPAGGSSTRAYIAWLGDEPVGFIQCYVVMGSGGGWWEDETDPGVRGIDQFLADGQRLGQGLGSSMVHAFVGEIFKDAQVTKVQTDPSPRNLRAIRSYRRAGFRVLRELVTPDGPALLMVCDRQGWEAARTRVVQRAAEDRAV